MQSSARAEERAGSAGNKLSEPKERRWVSRSRSRSPGNNRERGTPVAVKPENPGNNLHISGLSLYVKSRKLGEVFAKVGRVQEATVIYEPHTHISRGFGFVLMKTRQEANAAIDALNRTEFMGSIITVTRAHHGSSRTVHSPQQPLRDSYVPHTPIDSYETETYERRQHSKKYLLTYGDSFDRYKFYDSESLDGYSRHRQYQEYHSTTHSDGYREYGGHRYQDDYQYWDQERQRGATRYHEQHFDDNEYDLRYRGIGQDDHEGHVYPGHQPMRGREATRRSYWQQTPDHDHQVRSGGDEHSDYPIYSTPPYKYDYDDRYYLGSSAGHAFYYYY